MGVSVFDDAGGEPRADTGDDLKRIRARRLEVQVLSEPERANRPQSPGLRRAARGRRASGGFHPLGRARRGGDEDQGYR